MIGSGRCIRKIRRITSRSNRRHTQRNQRRVVPKRNFCLVLIFYDVIRMLSTNTRYYICFFFLKKIRNNILTFHFHLVPALIGMVMAVPVHQFLHHIFPANHLVKEEEEANLCQHLRFLFQAHLISQVVVQIEEMLEPNLCAVVTPLELLCYREFPRYQY